MTTGTVGTTSKPSRVVAGRARRPGRRDVRRATRAACSGREEDRQPAVGDLAGQLQVLRTDRGQVDRDVLAHRVHGQPQRLAGAVGQRQREVLARRTRTVSPAQRHADDVDVLAGAGQRLVEPDAVPALGHLRAGHAEAEPEPAAGRACRGSRPSSRSSPGCAPGSARPRCRRRSARSARPPRPARSRRRSRRPPPPRPPRSRAGRPPGPGRGCPRRSRRPSSRG